MGKKEQLLAVWILILIIGLFYLLTIREGHNWGDDFSMYIQHAKNIAEEKPYSITAYIYNPADPVGPQTYPPIFPFLLVPVYLVSGLDFQAMKLIPIALFLLSLYSIHLNF